MHAVSRGAVAIADQVAVGALAIGAVLLPARALNAAAYANLALFYAGYLFAQALHAAAIGELVLVFASGSVGTVASQTIRYVRRIDLLLVAIGLSSLLAAALTVSDQFRSGFLCLAAAGLTAPSWTSRRMWYAFDRIPSAVIQSAGAIALFLCAYFGAAAVGFRMSADVVLGCIAISGGATSALAWWVLARTILPREMPGDPDAPVEGTAALLWRYSRLSIVTAVLVWIGSNAGLFVLNQAATSADVAALRAALNLMLPWQQITVGLGVLMTSSLASVHSAGKRLTRNQVWAFAGVFGGGGLAFGAVLALLRTPLAARLYQADLFEGTISLLAFAPVLCALWGLQAFFASLARAHRAPGRIAGALGLAITVGWGGLIVTTQHPTLWSVGIAMVVTAGLTALSLWKWSGIRVDTVMGE